MSDLQTAQNLEAQAEAAKKSGDYVKAKAFYEQALALREQLFGVEHPNLIVALTALGSCLQELEKCEEAEQLYRRALRICEATFGHVDWRTAQALGNVAGILDEQGDMEQAGPLYEEAAHLIEQDLGPDHIEFAQALAKLGRFYRIADDPRAEAFLRRALAIYERSTKDSIAMAICLNNLAYLKNQQHLYVDAEALLHRALEINAHDNAGNSLNMAANWKNLAHALRGQGKTILGDLCKARALELYQQVFGLDRARELIGGEDD